MQHKRHGFTLVEVLIVVVILGILAATVLPQFNLSTDDSREAALTQNLQILRSQIELYKFQHGGDYPGSGTPTFEDQMLKSTQEDGTVGAVGVHPYGPYLTGQVPPNPYNGKRGLNIVTTDITAVAPGPTVLDGDSVEAGWIYNKSTGQIKANSAGNAADGTPLDEL
jgi:prepilin-type N-terminal cleavage/methylation domain-containing protein